MGRWKPGDGVILVTPIFLTFSPNSNMKKLIQGHIYVFFILYPFTSYSQQIYIGQDANEVGLIISADKASFDRARGYTQVTMQYQSLYNNGKLSDIVLCKQNVPMIDLERTVDYCTHYMIDHGKLSYILVEYSNISIQEVESVMDQSMKKIGDYYFGNSNQYVYFKLMRTGEVIKTYRDILKNPPPASILKRLNSGKFDKRTDQGKYSGLNTGVRKYIRDMNNKLNLEEKQQEKDNYEQAKLTYEDLMNRYTNLVTVVNSDERDLSTILPYFEILKIDLHLKINEHIKATYQKDSLLSFLPKYFHNEMVYFIISKDGELLSIGNKTDSINLTTEQYPLLKQWIKITGQVTLNYKNKDYPVNYRYPALNLQNENCPITTRYCFSVEGKEVGFIKDTSLMKSENGKCPVFIKYTFNKKEVEDLVYRYGNIKNIKDLKKIKGSPMKPEVIVPIPIINMIQTSIPRNSNLFILEEVKDREVTSITDNLNSLAFKASYYKLLGDNYYLKIYDPKNQQFIPVN